MKVLVPRVDPGEVKYSLRPRNFAYLIRVSMRPLLFLWKKEPLSHVQNRIR